MKDEKEIRQKMLDELGVSDGFEIEFIDSYFEREYNENAAYRGEDVPEDFILGEDKRFAMSEKERNLWRRVKELERMEMIRTWNTHGEREDSRPIDKTCLILESPKERRERLEIVFERFED